MTQSGDDIRRRALQERVRLAERDIADLQQQVDDGELDEATAASLQARYQSDLESARDSLAAMPKPKKGSPDPGGVVAGADSVRVNRTPLIVAAAAAAMVLLTVAIAVIATSGSDTPAGTTGSATGDLQPGAGSLADLEAAVASQPDNNAMRLALAQLYFDSGDYMNAMNHYATVTANTPTPEQAAVANARIGWMAWAALNDPETALTFLDAALALDPAYGEAILWKGVVLLYGMEDGPSAVPLFEQVLVFPDLPDALRPEVERMLDQARGGTP